MGQAFQTGQPKAIPDVSQLTSAEFVEDLYSSSLQGSWSFLYVSLEFGAGGWSHLLLPLRDQRSFDGLRSTTGAALWNARTPGARLIPWSQYRFARYVL